MLDAIVSPLCGLAQRLELSSRSQGSATLVTIGAQLAGVHNLIGAPEPPMGSYHIGGVGLTAADALVRTLGESVERYAQLTAEIFSMYPIVFGSQLAMRAADMLTLSADQLEFFTDSQVERISFPFAQFMPDLPVGWIKGIPLGNGTHCWIPAQLILVGYKARADLGEARIASGVTTGTAAHRSHPAALLNCLLELIQIDAAVGHWYGNWQIHELLLDERVDVVRCLLARAGGRTTELSFYWLPSPDLAGFVIACVARSRAGGIPAVVVGLGSSLCLDEAMYKAWLEATGVQRLAAVNVMQATLSLDDDPHSPRIYDLDSNVAWYARGDGGDFIDERFPRSTARLPAQELPPDVILPTLEATEYLISSFTRTGKILYHWDLTPPDVSDLGLVVDRVWSPHTLSLPLPSAAPLKHARFAAYGGAGADVPHPYP